MFRQDIEMNLSERPNAVTLPLLGKAEINDPSWKKLLSDALRKLDIVADDCTGKITIGVQKGGIVFVRKSETLKLYHGNLSFSMKNPLNSYGYFSNGLKLPLNCRRRNDILPYLLKCACSKQGCHESYDLNGVRTVRFGSREVFLWS